MVQVTSDLIRGPRENLAGEISVNWLNVSDAVGGSLFAGWYLEKFKAFLPVKCPCIFHAREFALKFY